MATKKTLIGTIPIQEIEQEVTDFINQIEHDNPIVSGETFSFFQDPEGRSEIKTDSDDKIINYRDSEGVIHENVGIETESIKISKNGLTDFQESLKRNGFQGGGMDFSNKEVIELPEPVHYGMLNLIIRKLPTLDGEVSEGYAEYYDFAGNYFKIPCSIEPQGQTSKIFAQTGGKGNYTLDLPKDIKFGSWVPQDSFHLKGCAKDSTRGLLSTSYKFAWKIMNYLDAKPNRVLMNESAITAYKATGKRITDWPDDARCLPDGFPCEIYINGEYWGLYAFQLKKHRKNYSMKKTDYTSFFIDAEDLSGFWDGNILWENFEIKNPNGLICMDGSKYDGDDPKELIDNTSPNWNPDNAKHIGSAQTKAIIQSWSAKYLEVKALIDNNDLVTAKTKFAEYFDVNACMLVYIFNCTMKNADSVTKNTLWATYSNGKIAPMLWDLDGMYGQDWTGCTIGSPTNLWSNLYATYSWPLALFWSLYETEIKATYAELRSNNIISIDTIHSILFVEWCERIGTEAYERDIEKWPETPNYRKNYTNTDYWTELYFGALNTAPIATEWNENTSYQTGDIVALLAHPMKPGLYMKYQAVQPNTEKCPVTKFYNEFPKVGGVYDSPKRMEKWMEAQLALCDSVMNYNN